MTALLRRLDTHRARRYWGRVPGLRVIVAYSIWFWFYRWRRKAG